MARTKPLTVTTEVIGGREYRVCGDWAACAIRSPDASMDDAIGYICRSGGTPFIQRKYYYSLQHFEPRECRFGSGSSWADDYTNDLLIRVYEALYGHPPIR